MAQILKADTAVIVAIGPFVDVTDGFTPETGVTLGGDEAEIIKAGATTTTDISGNTWAAITNCDGYYALTITGAQLDTEGPLTVVVQDDSVCLPVMARFQVVNANVYDSLFAAATTDYLQTDVTQLGGNAVGSTGGNIHTLTSDGSEVAKEGSLFDPTADAVATVTTVTNLHANAALEATLTAMKGATFSGATDSLEAIRNRGDAEWITATGFATSTKQDSMETTLDAAATAAALATVDTEVGQILADTGTDGVVLSSTTMNSIATALLDLTNGVETSWTLRQAMRIILAGVAGKLSGAATTTNTIRDVGDSANRIVATVDADGNRSAVTYVKT